MRETERRYQEIQEHWDKQSGIFQEIYESGVEEYIQRIKNIEESFKLGDRSLRCIDEGMPGGIHLAGSGILLGQEKAREILLKAQIDGIYSHAGCGAASLYAREQGLDLARADEYGEERAKELANIVGVPYKGHISKEELKRPPDFHIARALYYDGTGKFDPSRVRELPPGFVISRRYLDDPTYAKREVEIGTSIALGEHGFGGLITPKSPFVLIAIGDPNDPHFSTDTLKTELAKIAQERIGRVIVDGFTPAHFESE